MFDPSFFFVKKAKNVLNLARTEYKLLTAISTSVSRTSSRSEHNFCWETPQGTPCLGSKFSARFQLSKAASLSGIGVTASFWPAVKRVSKFTSGGAPARTSRENLKNFVKRKKSGKRIAVRSLFSVVARFNTTFFHLMCSLVNVRKGQLLCFGCKRIVSAMFACKPQRCSVACENAWRKHRLFNFFI